MLTKNDFDKLIELFPTREETRQEFEKIREEMATKDDFRQVMTVLDKVLKEVLAMRQDQDIHTQKHRDIDEEIKAIRQSLPA